MSALVRATTNSSEIQVFVFGMASGQQQSSPCEDLNTASCVGFLQSNPNICNEPLFAESTCKKTCGNCPLECYLCPLATRDPASCNQTITCDNDMRCGTRHLRAKDGHHEYIMKCESKATCSMFLEGFGKRHADDGSDGHSLERDVIMDCCDTDMCNRPVSPTTSTSTTTTAATTTTSTTQATTTTTRPTTKTARPTTTTTRPTTPPTTTTSTTTMPTTTTTTTTTQPTTTHMPSCMRDIVFVLQDSGMAYHRLWSDFISRLIAKMEFGGPYDARVAVLTYSSQHNVQIQWQLDEYSSKAELQQALHNLKVTDHINSQHDLKMTDTREAFSTVSNDIFDKHNGDRMHVDNAVVVLADGMSNHLGHTLNEAANLQSISKDVVAIGIGDMHDPQEINSFASDRRHAFHLRQDSDLAHIVAQVYAIICG